MNRSIREVLRDDKGIAEALGLVLIGLTVLVAVGMGVANYAILSKQAGQLQLVNQEIANRAEKYVAELNADLVNPRTPSLARECSSTTATCTQIIEATTSDDGKSITLRIQGDTGDTLGQSATKDVVLTSTQATHVTAIDETGSNVWGLTEEGGRFRAWGVATGDPTEVTQAELEDPATGVHWVSADDRAGIDSAGALWVWGANNIGQAGIGSVSAAPAQPTKLSIPSTTFRKVVTGDDRAYAIDSSGRVWAWGKNNAGQLGLGHKNAVTSPTKIPGIRMLDIAIGFDNAIGITNQHELVVAGAAQNGFPVTGNEAVFNVALEGTTFKAVAASVANKGAVAIREDGVLVVNGSTTTSPSGVVFASVARGANAGYAISEAGDLYGWGANVDGQLGLGATANASVATKLSAKKFTSVQGTRTGAIAIDVHGTLHYTGKVAVGFAGGPTLDEVAEFTEAFPEISFTQIVANDYDSAAALLDNQKVLYGMSTASAGLWSFDYQGNGREPIRMPRIDGFGSYMWKNAID